MFIIYSKDSGEVYNRVESTETAADGVLFGKIGDGKVGYHPNCNPGVYELTDEQNAAYEEDKRYSFDEETKTLTEIVPEPDKFEVLAERTDAIEAQITYTAMMTDTLIEEE